MAIFGGLSAFPITPCNANGAVLSDEYATILSRLVDANVDSIGVLGSTGTYAYLSCKERQRAAAVAAEVIGAKTSLVVGIGALRTDTAIALARDAERSGAAGLLMAPISYTPLTEEEVFTHFSSVAAATDLPLCIYNNPGTTHFTFSHALIARLSDVQNISAIKMPLCADIPEEMAALRAVTPDTFQIGYSGDWGCAGAMLAGAETWFSVIGGLFPIRTKQLADAAIAGDHAAAARLDAVFLPLWDLFQRFGSLRVIYAAAQILKLTQAELPKPLLPLGDRDRDHVAKAISGLT